MSLIRTRPLWGPFLARMVLGIVMFPHGAQKMLGWFGGGGFGETLGFFTSMGMPAPLAVLVMLAELGGSILLVLGLLGRLGAAGITAVMIGAIALVHAPHGFFMNWFGNQQGEGFEFHLLAIGCAMVVLWEGSGALSVDWALTRRKGVEARGDLGTPQRV